MPDTICPVLAIFLMSVIIFFSCCSNFLRSDSSSLEGREGGGGRGGGRGEGVRRRGEGRRGVGMGWGREGSRGEVESGEKG